VHWTLTVNNCTISLKAEVLPELKQKKKKEPLIMIQACNFLY